MKSPYFALCCSFFLLIACTQGDERSAQPSTSDSTLTIVDSTARVEAPQEDLPAYDQRLVWEGTIDKYPIEMILEISGNAVEGSYRYTSQKNSLQLKGEIDETGEYKLSEFDPEGKKTGVLRGVAEFQGRFTGSWSKSDSSEELLLVMWPKQVISRNINEYAPASLRYDINHLHRESAGKTCEIDVYYPYFYDFPAGVAERINAEMMGPSEEEIVARLAECQVDDELDEVAMGSIVSEGFRINAFVGPIMSISYDFYAYFSGAAHGNYGSDTYNFDMRTGQRLMPKDLFVEGYEEGLSAMIEQRLKEFYPEDHSYFEFRGIHAEQDYDLFADSLGVYFDPYEIAPYAAGRIEVRLAYDEIEQFIKADGPLGLR
ncbi:MAG: RsiV family protein [Bacteroidota bacterium]